MRIFIGWDSREQEAAEVLAWSIRERATVPTDIRFVTADLLRAHGFRMKDRPGSTEFTYSRFAVAYLCGYDGRALFLDCDMVCFGDVRELDDLPMDGAALRCVKHDYRPDATTKMDGQPQVLYPRKNWSSVMLLDCSKLRAWSKEAVESYHGGWLHRFCDVPDAAIGDLPKEWNSLDHLDESTKLWHLTTGGPWFPERTDCPHAETWLRLRDEMRAAKGAA